MFIERYDLVRYRKIPNQVARRLPLYPGGLRLSMETYIDCISSLKLSEIVWNNPGHQAWFEDGVRCRSYWLEEAGKDCAICFAVCPFSKMDKDFMNKYIKMTVANLAGSATVIRSLDDAFGYGVQKDPATWWDLDLPEYGIDTAQGKHD